MNRWTALTKAIEKNGACALVSIISTKGSTPRGADAWMIVTGNGFHGSVGGGTVEWRLMAEAESLLKSGYGKRVYDFVLGPDLGQCCGGRMQIEIEVFAVADLDLVNQHAASNAAADRQIFLFGAGHVGRALVLALAPLPFDVQWIDNRPNAFPSATPPNASLNKIDSPASVLQSAHDSSFVFVMTHSHALDFEIVDAALRHPTIAKVGLIGSATKRARFEKRLLEADVSKTKIAELICPIGVAGIVSKHPSSIAAAVVAQILQLDSVTESKQVRTATLFSQAG
jgi:xanthine dehydrogenase accessory factor